MGISTHGNSLEKLEDIIYHEKIWFDIEGFLCQEIFCQK